MPGHLVLGYANSSFIQIADPDPDPGGQKRPTKIEKCPEFSYF
jgi:hypothetical protein